MINKNTIPSVFIQTFLNKVKKFVQFFKKASVIHKYTFQQIQISFIYFFALVVLMYTIQSSLGYFPEGLFSLFPFLSTIMNFEILKFLAAPEKTFILYLLVLEILINRSIFNFSLLIKFNVLLIFILEMFQNLIFSYWDLLLSRELDLFDIDISMLEYANMAFFSFVFVLFFAAYIYSYRCALKGSFPSFPGPAQRIIDSVAFWLQMKLPKKGTQRKAGK
jgi:hypothetical protein